MTSRRPQTTAIPVNGAALRELRIRTGISVAELASEVGVQRPYISKIELGYSKRVSPQVYAAILKALGVRDHRTLLADPHAEAVA